MSPRTSIEIMIERKAVVREYLQARDSGDQEKANELEAKAVQLLKEASKLGDNFTTENAYGLMAY